MTEDEPTMPPTDPTDSDCVNDDKPPETYEIEAPEDDAEETEDA